MGAYYLIIYAYIDILTDKVYFWKLIHHIRTYIVKWIWHGYFCVLFCGTWQYFYIVDYFLFCSISGRQTKAQHLIYMDIFLHHHKLLFHDIMCILLYFYLVWFIWNIKMICIVCILSITRLGMNIIFHFKSRQNC